MTPNAKNMYLNSKSKDKVLKLGFFSSWRTVWLTCTNKSEGCINKHQCDLQNISKIKQKCRNSPPSIAHCLATSQRYVLWIVDFLVVSKLWYQNDDSDSWLPCLIISTEIVYTTLCWKLNDKTIYMWSKTHSHNNHFSTYLSTSTKRRGKQISDSKAGWLI